MMSDVRNMHVDDVQPTWDFIKKKSKTLIDVTHDDDDGRWFVSIKGLGWRASLNCGGFNFKSTNAETYPLTGHSFAYLHFHPPGGGNIRFDVCVNVKDHPQIVAEIASMLIEHGGAGKNRVGYFIGGSVSGEKTLPTTARSFWRALCFWR